MVMIKSGVVCFVFEKREFFWFLAGRFSNIFTSHLRNDFIIEQFRTSIYHMFQLDCHV